MPTARSARADVPWDGGSEAVQLPGRFEYFYLQEYPRVVAFAYALSGSRTGAEDIAQEAFLRAYRDWTGLAPMSIGSPGCGGLPPTWPPRAAAAGGRGTRADPAGWPVGAGRGPVAGRERRVLGGGAGLALPPSPGGGAVLLEDRSIRQTAAVLGCAEGTVKAHLAKARRALARHLQVDGGEAR